MHIGAKIREIRESKGIKQNFIESKLGWYSGRLGRIENNEQPVMAKELIEIADILSTPIGEFYLSSDISMRDKQKEKGA